MGLFDFLKKRNKQNKQASEFKNNNVNVTFMRCIVKNTNNGQLVRLYGY